MLDIPAVGPLDTLFGDLDHLWIRVCDSDLANGRTGTLWATVTF